MPTDLVAETAKLLQDTWSRVCSLGETGELSDQVEDAALRESIHCAMNSRTKTYRYVLPTQVVAKVANASLDCRCLQAGRGGAGAFDARTIAHKVVVPFDQSNENVLGGSPEPYVNNPLRVPEISAQYRAPQKNKVDWDHLSNVLGAVEDRQDAAFTDRVFSQILTEIYRRLAQAKVVYAVPRRISLEKALGLIDQYLGEHSGGDRLLALVSALFVVIGRRFGLYADVRRSHITAADSATGLTADLECVSQDDTIVLAVEVKDRDLTISQMRNKIPNIRENQVSEVFFVAQQGIADGDEESVRDLIANEFAAGHNVYVTDLISLTRVVLALLGETGRHSFLEEVGNQLDSHRSDIAHRRKWAELLRTV